MPYTANLIRWRITELGVSPFGARLQCLYVAMTLHPSQSGNVIIDCQPLWEMVGHLAIFARKTAKVGQQLFLTLNVSIIVQYLAMHVVGTVLKLIKLIPDA